MLFSPTKKATSVSSPVASNATPLSSPAANNKFVRPTVSAPLVFAGFAKHDILGNIGLTKLSTARNISRFFFVNFESLFFRFYYIIPEWKSLHFPDLFRHYFPWTHIRKVSWTIESCRAASREVIFLLSHSAFRCQNCSGTGILGLPNFTPRNLTAAMRSIS